MVAKIKNQIFLMIFFLVFPCFSSALVFGADSAKIVSDANRLYLSDKYDQALNLYNQALNNNPDSARVNYNIGAVNFKKADYGKAVEFFEKALVTEDKILEYKANYNIANAKYKLGKLKENTDLSATIQLLRESLDYYKRAIELDSKDEDAKVNHELVEKELKVLLDRLKQQQENQKKQPQDQKNNDGQKEQQQPQAGEQKKKEEGKEENNSDNKESQAQEQEKKKQEAEKKETKEQEGQQAKQGEQTERENQSSQTEESQEGQEQGELKEMSPEEAKMLLEGYRQEENAKEKIRYDQQSSVQDVLKDW